MKDKEIDDILSRAAKLPHEVDAELVSRISESVTGSLRPVRPVPPLSILALGQFLIYAGVALAGAALLGFHGVQKLSPIEIGVIFPTLVILAGLAAKESAGEVIPGSPRPLSPAQLAVACVLILLVMFALLFEGYGVDHFVPHGVPCLVTGLLHAIVAGVLSWFLLRGGFAVDAGAAGLSAATLASLAGVTMLELHCGNLQALHVMVWHVSVIPLSGAAGVLLGVRARR
jgi:hypothetical protein